VYGRLLDLSLTFCDTALVVVTHDAKSAQVLEALAPFVKKQSQEAQWPGTQMTTGTATVYRFRLCRHSVRVLNEAVESLYGWQQRMNQLEHPQDLCLLRPDGSRHVQTLYKKTGSLMDFNFDSR